MPDSCLFLPACVQRHCLPVRLTQTAIFTPNTILCCSYGLLKRVLWIQGKVDGEASKEKLLLILIEEQETQCPQCSLGKKKTFATLFSGIPSRLTSLFSPSHPALCPSRNLADLSSFVSSILSDHLPKSFRTSSRTSLFPLLPHVFTGPCQYQSAACALHSFTSGFFVLVPLVRVLLLQSFHPHGLKRI